MDKHFKLIFGLISFILTNEVMFVLFGRALNLIISFLYHFSSISY